MTEERIDCCMWTYSDDCAGAVNYKDKILFSDVEISEYEIPGKWLGLYRGEEKIGEVMVQFDTRPRGGWVFHLRGEYEDEKLSIRED